MKNEEIKELYNKSYSCKNEEVNNLLEEIETIIKQKGNEPLLLRAKTVITTRLLLIKENNTRHTYK